MAPEILESKGYGVGVDYWSLGILIFEMLTGTTPFDDEDPYQVFKNIRNNEVKYPRWIKASSKALIKSLLTKDPS